VTSGGAKGTSRSSDARPRVASPVRHAAQPSRANGSNRSRTEGNETSGGGCGHVAPSTIRSGYEASVSSRAAGVIGSRGIWRTSRRWVPRAAGALEPRQSGGSANPSLCGPPSRAQRAPLRGLSDHLSGIPRFGCEPRQNRFSATKGSGGMRSRVRRRAPVRFCWKRRHDIGSLTDICSSCSSPQVSA
jgi:hypothetical protein